MSAITYTARMAIKTPSTQVQYRMLEADVSATGDDPDLVVKEARDKLATAVMVLANTFGETPPLELKGILTEIHGEDEVADCYGDGY